MACSAYLLAVLALDSDRRDVLPAESMDDLDHSLGLKIVRRHDPAEVLEAALVRQLGARRGVTYLRYLQKQKSSFGTLHCIWLILICSLNNDN